MNLTNTHSVLVLAVENSPLLDTAQIIDRQIGFSGMGELIAGGVSGAELRHDCSWIQSFYKNATLALQFIRQRDMDAMTSHIQRSSSMAKLSIHKGQPLSHGLKVTDFVDECVGDIALDLRHIATRRPTLAYAADQHYQRMEEFLSQHKLLSLAPLCTVSLGDGGMNFHVNL